eukprot:m.753847 g.753847  ORF g.753847 m.753847 type:complete len:1015 (+) comp23174_c1_seq4:297-3341(+)
MGPKTGREDGIVFPHQLTHHSNFFTGGMREAWAEDAARTPVKQPHFIASDNAIKNISPPKSIKVVPCAAVDPVASTAPTTTALSYQTEDNEQTNLSNIESAPLNAESQRDPVLSEHDNNVGDTEFELVRAALVGSETSTDKNNSKNNISESTRGSLSYDTLLSERERLLAQLEEWDDRCHLLTHKLSTITDQNQKEIDNLTAKVLSLAQEKASQTAVLKKMIAAMTEELNIARASEEKLVKQLAVANRSSLPRSTSKSDSIVTSSEAFQNEMKQIREMLKCRSAEVAIQSDTIKNLHSQIRHCETSAASALQCVSFLAKVVFGDGDNNPLLSVKTIDNTTLPTMQAALNVNKLTTMDTAMVQDIGAQGLWVALQRAHTKADDLVAQSEERVRKQEQEMHDLRATLDAAIAQVHSVQAANQDRLDEKNDTIQSLESALAKLGNLVSAKQGTSVSPKQEPRLQDNTAGIANVPASRSESLKSELRNTLDFLKKSEDVPTRAECRNCQQLQKEVDRLQQSMAEVTRARPTGDTSDSTAWLTRGAGMSPSADQDTAAASARSARRRAIVAEAKRWIGGDSGDIPLFCPSDDKLKKTVELVQLQKREIEQLESYIAADTKLQWLQIERLQQGLADVVAASSAGTRTTDAALFLAVHAHQARRSGELCAQAGDLFFCPNQRTHTVEGSGANDTAMRVERVFHTDSMHGSHTRADGGNSIVTTAGVLPLQKLQVIDIPGATQHMFTRLSQDYEELLDLYKFGPQASDFHLVKRATRRLLIKLQHPLAEVAPPFRFGGRATWQSLARELEAVETAADKVIDRLASVVAAVRPVFVTIEQAANKSTNTDVDGFKEEVLDGLNAAKKVMGGLQTLDEIARVERVAELSSEYVLRLEDIDSLRRLVNKLQAVRHIDAVPPNGNGQHHGGGSTHPAVSAPTHDRRHAHAGLGAPPPPAGMGAHAGGVAHTSDLPEGWEECTDPYSGCTYFANHITRQTTWLDPRTMYPKQPTQLQLSGRSPSSSLA